MEFHISDLLDDVGVVGVDLKPDTSASAKRIKELTMKKIHGKNQRKHRPLSLLAKALIAAAILAALAVPAMAASGFWFTDWLMPRKETNYDTDPELDAYSKNWAVSGWIVNLAAIDPSAEGITVICDQWGQDGEEALTGTLAVDESFWLEVWNGEAYDKLPEPQHPVPAGETVQIQPDTLLEWNIDWTASYGSLESGDYRLGKNFFYTNDAGERETVPMYVKFRVVTPGTALKDAYDTNLASGSASKNWEVSNWVINLAAREPGANGLTMVCDQFAKMTEEPLTGTLAVDESYWLEIWNGEGYDKLPEPEQPVPVGQTIQIEPNTVQEWAIDWTASYGTLEPGAYRLGKNFFYTNDAGKTETVPMYVKFRVFNQDMGAVVKQCRDMVAELLNRESYHLVDTWYLSTWDPNSKFDYATFEYWKNGRDFLEDRTYFDKGGNVVAHNGYLLRDGKGYELAWTGDSVLSPLASWQNADWITSENGKSWDFQTDIFDSDIGFVSGDENSIQVLMSAKRLNGSPYYTERSFTQNEEGKLIGFYSASVPGLTYSPDQRTVTKTLEVYDTPQSEIAQIIAAQAVGEPLTFSWEEDRAQYPVGSQGVKTEGFTTTAPKPLADANAAIAAAQVQCTMEWQNMATVAYDQAAQMWKVTLKFSQDDEHYQIVYLTSDGLPQLVVTK